MGKWTSGTKLAPNLLVGAKRGREVIVDSLSQVGRANRQGTYQWPWWARERSKVGMLVVFQLKQKLTRALGQNPELYLGSEIL